MKLLMAETKIWESSAHTTRFDTMALTVLLHFVSSDRLAGPSLGQNCR